MRPDLNGDYVHVKLKIVCVKVETKQEDAMHASDGSKCNSCERFLLVYY